jgi:hypothetical protein
MLDEGASDVCARPIIHFCFPLAGPNVGEYFEVLLRGDFNRDF